MNAFPWYTKSIKPQRTKIKPTKFSVKRHSHILSWHPPLQCHPFHAVRIGAGTKHQFWYYNHSYSFQCSASPYWIRSLLWHRNATKSRTNWCAILLQYSDLARDQKSRFIIPAAVVDKCCAKTFPKFICNENHREASVWCFCEAVLYERKTAFLKRWFIKRPKWYRLKLWLKDWWRQLREADSTLERNHWILSPICPQCRSVSCVTHYFLS